MTRKGPAAKGLAVRWGDKHVNTITSLMEGCKVLWACVEKWVRDAQVCPEESRKALGESEHQPDDPYKGNRSWPGERGCGLEERGSGLRRGVERKGGQDKPGFQQKDFILTCKGTR